MLASLRTEIDRRPETDESSTISQFLDSLYAVVLTGAICTCAVTIPERAFAEEEYLFEVIDDLDFYQQVAVQAGTVTNSDTGLLQAATAATDTTGSPVPITVQASSQTSVINDAPNASIGHESNFSRGGTVVTGVVPGTPTFQQPSATKWKITSPTVPDGTPVDLDGLLTITSNFGGGGFVAIAVDGDLTITGPNGTTSATFNSTAGTVTIAYPDGTTQIEPLGRNDIITTSFDLRADNPDEDAEVGDEIVISHNLKERLIAGSGNVAGGIFTFTVDVHANDVP